MSRDQGEQIFLLWHELKKATQMAREAELGDVESILRITADTLVQKYYSQGHPTQKELHSLVWEKQDWPATTATFMELKSMLKTAAELDKDSGTDSSTSNCA